MTKGAVLLLALSVGQCSSPTGNNPVDDPPIHLAQELDFIRLTHNDAIESQLAWSPDGKHIAFISLRDEQWDVYVMDNDGQNLQPLTQNDAYDARPVWSPDGKHIAFTSDRGGDWDIWLIE